MNQAEIGRSASVERKSATEDERSASFASNSGQSVPSRSVRSFSSASPVGSRPLFSEVA